MVITPFLTHQVTTTGDFTQKIMGHTAPMVIQRLGPTYQILPNPPAKPGLKRRLPRIGAGCPTEVPGCVLGWPMKITATPLDTPAAVLQRLPTIHSSPPPGYPRASQNRVRLFSPCESLFRVISAGRPAYILGATKSASGGIPMVQTGYLPEQEPQKRPGLARGE